MISTRQIASEKIEFLFHLLENDPFDLDVEGQSEELSWTNNSNGSFLLNYHGVTEQLWYSSPLSGAHHFKVDLTTNHKIPQWICTRTGRPFNDILSLELSQLIGRTIILTDEGVKYA